MTYLAHHGIKGQKWGIRRYQNPDGSLTQAGKSKYRNEKSGNNKIYSHSGWKAYTAIDYSFRDKNSYALGNTEGRGKQLLRYARGAKFKSSINKDESKRRISKTSDSKKHKLQPYENPSEDVVVRNSISVVSPGYGSEQLDETETIIDKNADENTAVQAAKWVQERTRLLNTSLSNLTQKASKNILESAKSFVTNLASTALSSIKSLFTRSKEDSKKK